MPFITQERRFLIEQNTLDGLVNPQPGDRCYVFYKEMVEKWRAEPRWTTAHNIFKSMAGIDLSTDDGVAHFLAWQVFFQLHVMPYELRKREENGDI
jgi:hypothetical protein